MTKDRAKAAEADRKLSLRELDEVSGGLKSQPLPPLLAPWLHFLIFSPCRLAESTVMTEPAATNATGLR